MSARSLAEPRRSCAKARYSVAPSGSEHYAALYARPRALHDAFEQFAAFTQDAIDDKALLGARGKLAMPVLAVGAEKSFGAGMAEVLKNVATNVTGGIVPASGHWVMEENPEATTKLVVDFLAK
jgi:pimeloyl-ACP methyl ester carboxylesterase